MLSLLFGSQVALQVNIWFKCEKLKIWTEKFDKNLLNFSQGWGVQNLRNNVTPVNWTFTGQFKYTRNNPTWLPPPHPGWTNLVSIYTDTQTRTCTWGHCLPMPLATKLIFLSRPLEISEFARMGNSEMSARLPARHKGQTIAAQAADHQEGKDTRKISTQSWDAKILFWGLNFRFSGHSLWIYQTAATRDNEEREHGEQCFNSTALFREKTSECVVTRLWWPQSNSLNFWLRYLMHSSVSSTSSPL